MWVKICANTNTEDALAAIEFGADALGFVFAPSTRQVNAEQVRAIAAHLPQHVERVGVFHDSSAVEIVRAVETAGLSTAQLHGGFDRSITEYLRKHSPELELIQVVHWDLKAHPPYSLIKAQLERIAEFAADTRVLVDAKVQATTGGTGVSFDWSAAQSLFAGFDRLRIILAGGLRPENVAEAIRTVHPWGVDVASGTESEPGKKDRAKLKAFIENARRA